MKKHLIYITSIFLLSLTSCNDWLDVQPEASVSVEELFSSEEGFFEAINGIYTKGADNYLYGGLFTVEIQDVLAQDYSFKVQDYTQYAKTAMFDFTNTMFKTRNSLIWSNAYNAIVNANLILENIDSRKALFHEGMYELVKGEALALRAFIHIDLLRYFGRIYSTGASQPAIPYVKTYSNKVTALSTGQQVVEFVLEDLNQAKQLLSTCDPILSDDYVVGYNNYSGDTESTETEGTLFLQNRRHRLNYYAVCGLLARVNLLAGKVNDALSNAQEVINSHKFPWTNRDRMLAEEATRDRLTYTELLFAWYIENQEDNMRSRFENTTTGYYVANDHLRDIYEMATVGADDDRVKCWFTLNTDGNYRVTKYLRNSDDVGNIHFLVAPAIRLSEMYYIAAECQYATNPAEAWSLLTTVRTQRGIGTPFDADADFFKELLKEYRKEMFSEGQSFYAYKRLGANIQSESGMVFTPAQIAPIPLPDDEIEFGQRN